MLWLFLRRLLLQSLLWLLWPLLLWLLLLLLFDYSFCSCTAVVATGVVVVSDSCCSYNGSNYGCCSSNYLLLRLSEICATHTAKIGTDGRPFEYVFWLTGCTSGQTSWTCVMSSIIGYYFHNYLQYTFDNNLKLNEWCVHAFICLLIIYFGFTF